MRSENTVHRRDAEDAEEMRMNHGFRGFHGWEEPLIARVRSDVWQACEIMSERLFKMMS